MELLEYFRMIKKHLWLIAIIFIITLVGVYIGNELVTPVYQAEAVVMVKQNRVAMSIFEEQGLGKDSVRDYVELVKSRSMAEKVARLLYPEKELTLGLINSVKSRVQISIVSQTNLIKISVTSEDPDGARDLANAYAQVFIDDSRISNQQETRAAREFIEEQLRIVSEQLWIADEKLLAFKQEKDTVIPTDETRSVLELLTKLEAERAVITLDLSELDTKLSEAYKLFETQEETVISSTTITNNPILAAMKQKLTDLELELSKALERYTEKHPTVISLKSEIEDLKLKMGEEVERIIETETITVNPIRQTILNNLVDWETNKAALFAKRDALDEIIMEVEAQLDLLPEKELELAQLLRDQSVAEKIYMILLENNEEIKIAEARETSDIRLVDEAVSPSSYIKPRKKTNLTIGGLLSLMIGCGLAILIEILDTTIKTPEDVEQILGLPVMGVIYNLNDTQPRRKRKRKKSHSEGMFLEQ
jgi:succinoglycan biosynthesis transport protein ExoP